MTGCETFIGACGQPDGFEMDLVSTGATVRVCAHHMRDQFLTDPHDVKQLRSIVTSEPDNTDTKITEPMEAP